MRIGIDRRRFLQTGAATLAAGTSILRPSIVKAVSANEKIVLGVMGVRGRGRFHAENFAKHPQAVVAWICDVDSGAMDSAAQAVEKITGKRPKTTGDFRRILDDKEVHALVNATPDHWHALPTIMACQAGKDVYVEKPASHNIFEGQKMVEAARKYNRVVQLGTQTRSGAYTMAALDYVRSGKLGKVHLARVINMKQSGNIGHVANSEPPKGVDYDMWLGAAPKRPFNANRFHGGWYWFWDYSGGDLVNDSIHQIDIARAFLNKDYPKSVTAVGGKYHFKDDQECPDTLQVNVEYDDATMIVEVALWTPYEKKVGPEDRESLTYYPDWRLCGERIELYGTEGLMMFGRHGIGWQVLAPDGKVVAEGNGPVPQDEHVANFFDCIRSRKLPNADILEGHRSTLLSHLGNISHRVGGRRLEFDGAGESILHDEEAEKLMKRAYREEWRVPDKV